MFKGTVAVKRRINSYKIITLTGFAKLSLLPLTSQPYWA